MLSGLENDPLWYKDAIIYEAHVRAFYDSNEDGMGDFRGLAQKLDYLEDLGVTAIWLLPFFPSPWKDDGYDIADFRSVHPAYGTLKDFQQFLKEAHRRGLRVITELVINHTSDQHEWFQKSRRAEPGSRWRDFYVWSDNPEKYAGTRIIFKDFEPSNWTWDPVAKAYYWHRFFSHQPDLNFDNPLVQRSVMHLLDFWAEMGVDAFRLDAIPYLFEREGTSCENLPETHAFLKELRLHLDERFPNRMLLSEANMWPEDAVAYMGNGDECHMNFHFPLMPRLFMALRLEDRLPIVEILQRTPVLPETCQWAMFLRNHDELTLEMVTDEERDYMYRMYASDQRARINLGIRRRLAPLLQNDRPRIEVMNALLFSMPGTPVIYYGDEIGMGDNVYLGDRNGVRTPMQWSPDRNAGFSNTNPQRLYLPVNIDPAYHYEAINVEAQQDNPHSLLNWTKRLIALRKQYKAFGRGTLEFLYPSNQRVIAYYRRYQEETILVVANLSRFAQPIQLDLHKYQGYTPVEVFGRTDFPVIGESYYPLTLGPNSFYWFSLEQHAVPVSVSAPLVEARGRQLEVVTLHAGNLWDSINLPAIAEPLQSFLSSRTWFRSKDRRFRSIEIREAVSVGNTGNAILLVRVDFTSGDPETYSVPVSVARGEATGAVRQQHPEDLIAEIKWANGAVLLLYEGTIDNEFTTSLLEAFARRRRFAGQEGTVNALRNREFRQLWGASHPNLDPKILPSATFDTTIQFGDRFVMKLLRRVEPGTHPGVELGEFLTERQHFPNAAPFGGFMAYQPRNGEATVLAMLDGYVPHSGDGWSYTRNQVATFLKRAAESKLTRADVVGVSPRSVYSVEGALVEPPDMVRELLGPVIPFAENAGKRVAELHLALLTGTNSAFSPEVFNDFYRQSLYHANISLTGRRLEFIRQRYADMPADVRTLAAKVLELEPAIITKFKAIFERRVPSVRIRFHGRLHLGHMLVTAGDDITIFDFEGDPALHISERRIKRCPLRDVTSMLLSFAYATQTTSRHLAESELRKTVDLGTFRMFGRFWYSHVSAAFLRGYWRTAGQPIYMPPSRADQQVLLDNYLLERALLDVRADISEKPDLAGIPFRVILHLLNAEEREPAE